MALETRVIEVCRMKFRGWAWRCWVCDLNHFGYGDDETNARLDAAEHARQTHVRKEGTPS